MPCRSDGPDTSRAELDKVTRLLCYCCGSLMDADGVTALANPALDEWWANHRSSDERRVRGEMQQRISQHPKESTVDAVARRFMRAATRVHPVSDYHARWFRRLAEEECRNYSDRDAVRREGLSKLTDEEIDELGLQH